jgi:proline dehydrogenase
LTVYSKTPPPPLTPEEITQFNALLNRLDTICKSAKDHNVKLLIDAEQTYFQAAIDYLTIYMCKKYNTKSPIVYNTYQMYLKDSKDRLMEDIDIATRGKFYLGVKLVRGM